MNQDVGGNRKPFWKVVGKAYGGKVNCSRIEDGYGRLSVEEDGV